MNEKLWILRRESEEDKNLRDLFTKEFGISPVTAQILINRNVTSLTDARMFLGCSLSSLHNPRLLKDMDKAVFRIKQAIAQKERVMIYGDYDVDGICSVALLVSVFAKLGLDVSYHIPNRLEEGYGVNKPAVMAAKKKKVSLIITVDCGVGANEEVKYANKLGIDIIITDHHEIVGKLPKALAIINPLQSDCAYPFKHLAGVGLAYKLAECLVEDKPIRMAEYLDFVALGNVADVVPQIGENRILTRYGLVELNKTDKAGLKALMDVSGLSGKQILSGHIGYILGPRINASGRLGSPEMSVKLLLTKDANEAKELAQILDKENRRRQNLESKMLQEALSKVESEIDLVGEDVIVLSSDDWHKGVIGIVASRISEKFYKPTVLIAVSKGMGRGSGRSIAHFNLVEAVGECKEYLVNFGGHEGACGLTIEKKEIGPFKRKLNEVAGKLLSAEVVKPRIEIDMEVPLNIISSKLICEIEGLSPFGPWNPKPILSSRNLGLKRSPTRMGKDHFKIWVTDNKLTCEAVGFRMAGSCLHKINSGRVDIVYSPEMNNWRGMSSIQLTLQDIRNSSSS